MLFTTPQAKLGIKLRNQEKAWIVSTETCSWIMTLYEYQQADLDYVHIRP